MVKNLTLITDHKNELESDMYQDEFLKEYGYMPSYKPHFELKFKMNASLISQTTSLVALFKLPDEVTKVKIQVDGRLDVCLAEVVGEDHVDACFSGWGDKDIPVLFRPLQSLPVFNLSSNDQLDLMIQVLTKTS